MIYILKRPLVGASGARSIRMRASSTLLLEAASISKTHGGLQAVTSTHCVHTWQGSAVGPFSHRKDLARILALDVLPVPRGPVNKYACDIFSLAMALDSVLATDACPTSWPSDCGRCFK